MNHYRSECCAADGLVPALLGVSRVLAERVEAAMGEVGLTAARFGALDHLVQAGEPLPLGELAARLSCVRSNVTQLVDRLEADGLVRRVADPADRRSVRAEVTAAGRERWRRGAAQFRAVESALEARIGDGDREALARVLALIQEERTG